MLRDDFIERMIWQLAEAIARIAGRTANGKRPPGCPARPRRPARRADARAAARRAGEDADRRRAARRGGARSSGEGHPAHALLCNKRAFELFLEARALDPQPGDDSSILELGRRIPPTEIDTWARYRTS